MEERVAKLEKTVAKLLKHMKSAGSENTSKKSTSRTPSEYQIFMKNEMPKIKEEFPDKKHSEVFSICAKRWKSRDIS